MSNKNSQAAPAGQNNNDGTLTSYIAGFILSLAFTLTAYTVVYLHTHSHTFELSKNTILPLILVFAIVQVFVQLRFFLHFGKDASPRWNALMMLLAVAVIGIVVGGSVWIMSNLNAKMMPTPQVNQYLKSQDSL